MCGIAGALMVDRDEAHAAVTRACEQMVPRGPDDFGIEAVEQPGGYVVLGSQRLAIIDPSPAGHQPMRDPERGTTIVYNGMIYNFGDLRRELARAGETFVSSCDTEVILKAYNRWGTDCVHRLRGMFAFAIWDDRRNELFLARDRLGIKPLYYWHQNDELVFASQVKAILQTGVVAPNVSPAAVTSYLEFGAVSEPLTAIEGIHALPAGHLAVLRDAKLTVKRYWELPAEPDLRLNREDAREELRQRLKEAVERHLVSDVPLGVFLSGGIDSSVLAALAAERTSTLRTISVVFRETSFSEEPYIEAVARRLGTEHVRVDLRPKDLLAWSAEAFDAMDQPSFDGLNTYVVSRAASESGLKVALSGLGGDELFDGYGLTRRAALLETVKRLPASMQRVAARVVALPSRASRNLKLRDWLGSEYSRGSSYDLLRRLFLPNEVRALLREDARIPSPQPRPLDFHVELYGQISRLDLTNYMKNVLLRDTDAMSMGNSLEARVPYLDDALVDWVLRLPAAAKAGKGKALLVSSVQELIPSEVWRRPKQGFILPFRRWMENELRAEIAQSLADPPAAVAALLDPAAVARVWQGYQQQRENWIRPWALYALTKWARTIETWSSRPVAAAA